MVHFDDNQFENHRSDGYRRLKPTAVPTLFTLERGPTSYGRLQRTDNISNEPLCYEDSITIFESDDGHAEMVEQQRMTFVQARIDEVRESFRGRQTSTRGRRRGRPRKRPNDDLDEWTPDRPRAVRGRKRGRPPAGGGRGRQTVSVSPVRKAPRGRGRVANERQRPGPKPKLEGPGPPPAVITPGGKCFVCSKAAGSTGSPLSALTNTTKIQLHQKLGRVVGAELDLIVDEDGVLCHGCCRLLNYMDRIEVEHSMLTKSILNCMRRTFGFGYVQGDNRMPEAVLASIEDNSKTSIIPVEKQDPTPDVPEMDTSDAVLRSTAVAPSDTEAKKKNQMLLVDRVPEKKTDAKQDTKSYQCKICNFENKHKSVFLFHLQRHIQSSYRCDFCNSLLPKGFKILDTKTAETSSGETANKNEVIPHPEAPEVQVTKEVKDYVETMIEELHTTGIVTTMKPVTPEKFKPSSEMQIDNVHSKETVISAALTETKDTSIIYEQQSGTSIEQGTLNILLTFPNERRQSISVHHDVSVENNFSNDVVARQLRDIFGNFNDEPMDVDKNDVPGEKSAESLNTDFVKTLDDVPLLENSPVSIDSKIVNHKQEQNETPLKEISTQNPDSESCTDDINVDPENSSCNEDTDEKYQKQLALLDEMGLIMLPKRARPSARDQSAESVVKESEGTVDDSRDQHWDGLCHTENPVEPSQEHEGQNTQGCELQMLKEQTQWLPESLSHAETTTSTKRNVTETAESDEQLQSADATGNGNEWLKSNVPLVNESSHWLHQADNTSTTTTTTNGNDEITVWTNTASHSDQSQTLTEEETERNWLLREKQISEPNCTNVKETDIEDVDTNRDTHVWDPARNGNTDSGENIFKKSDELESNTNSVSPASINNEGVISTTIVPGSEVTDSNQSFFAVEKEEQTDNSLSNKQCVTADEEDLNVNVTSLHSEPAVQNTDQDSSPTQDVDKEMIAHSEETEIVSVTQTESGAQECLSTVFITDNTQLAAAESGQVVSSSKQEYTEDSASTDSCDTKQFDFETSETTLCSEVGNTVESEAAESNFRISEGDVHSLKVKELDDTNSTRSVASELKVYSDKSGDVILVEGQSDYDLDESSTEPNFESIKR